MSKNAWSFGCRFVAAAALTIGASAAVTGTAAANDGGATRPADCPRAVAMGSSGCQKARVKKARVKKARVKKVTRPGYGRPHHRPRYYDRGREFDAFIIIKHLSRDRGRMPMTDPFGLSASRGTDRPLPLRVDPSLRTMPQTAASETLAAAPRLPDPQRLTVTGRVVDQAPAASRTTEIKAKVRELPRTVGSVSDRLGVLLRSADNGNLLTPPAAMIGR